MTTHSAFEDLQHALSFAGYNRFAEPSIEVRLERIHALLTAIAEALCAVQEQEATDDHA